MPWSSVASYSYTMVHIHVYGIATVSIIENSHLLNSHIRIPSNNFNLLSNDGSFIGIVLFPVVLYYYNCSDINNN